MKSPAFQFYAAEFLADENVVLMTNQEVGCYIKLMAYCWREGSIPADTNKMARLCGEDSLAMAQLWTAISKCFVESLADDCRLVHPRLEKERSKQDEHRKERAESGKRGAEKRWGAKMEQSHSKSHDSANSSANSSSNSSAIDLPMANDGSSSSSSSSNKKDKSKGSTFVPPLWVDQQLWADFMEMRKAIKKPATDRAQELLVIELKKLMAQGFEQQDILNNSIRNNWQDLYAPKTKAANGSNGGFVC